MRVSTVPSLRQGARPAPRSCPLFIIVVAVACERLSAGGLVTNDTAASGARGPADRPNIILVYTDDHGYADLSCQGVRDDVKTPHTDHLASGGARLTAGYASAPQCRPSRAGLLTGRYQNRFGLEANGDGALPWSESTIAERLAAVGYVTGMCGKWHLDGWIGSNGERLDGTLSEIPRDKEGHYSGERLKNPGHAGKHGFQEFLCGSMRSYLATHDAAGRVLGGTRVLEDRRFRIDVQAEWAARFIERHAAEDAPFFLYVPFFAPHVPLEAPGKYLARFSGEMPRRRRLALAMIAAVDDGLGRMMRALTAAGVVENTLVFYLSDNGAPLKIHKIDAPGGGPGWDGSLNDPWVGEKGMLTEGGIRVPYIVRWPARIPAGTIYDRPVINLDATATALAAAGLEVDHEIDGVNLVPYVTRKASGDPHGALYWRWGGQAAIRAGDWKYLVGGGREYLFDLASADHEHRNLIEGRTELAATLRRRLEAWTRTLIVPELPQADTPAGNRFYDHYLNGKPAARPSPERRRDPAAVLKARDVNKDGVLTLREYIGDPTTRDVSALRRRFRRLDVDRDSRLTLDEMRNGK